MKISYNWLQKHIEQKLPKPEELREKIIFHAFEIEDIETLEGDTIMDIKVLPDRAHDCLSHYGMAREVAGLYGYTLKPYIYEALSKDELTFPVEIQSELCHRYIAIEIDDVTVGPSPAWLKEALESVGARSINNVVDATNYVLFDRGQPVHAFDKAKIDGGIVVRLAHEHEQITTLSKEEKQLQTTDLVIADYLGVLAIAGVKGGISAEVTDETKTIIVEIANFEPITVRKTSRKLGLVTDASKRFENEITPAIASAAAGHVVSLIKEIAGGTVVGVKDIYPHPVEDRTISFQTADITRLLGAGIDTESTSLVFDQYKYTYTKDADTFILTVPQERLDIIGPHDIAEEIGRALGYDRVASTTLPFTLTSVPSEYEKTRAVKWWLAKNGFREVMNYSFRKKGDVYVAHGPKDKSALRTNLSDGLKESYELNKINKALLGLDNVRLFEVGTIFLADKSSSAQDFSGTKEELRVATVDGGVFEELSIDVFMEKYNINTASIFTAPQIVGVFKEWSKYPHITRDIAVWVEGEEGLATLDAISTDFAKQYCVREPNIFDRFEKDGRTSIAYRFVFQAADRTLTEIEVNEWFSILIKKIEEQSLLTIR